MKTDHANDSCVTAYQLEDLILGRLSEPTAGVIEAHIDGCRICLSKAAELQVESRLMRVLHRKPRREPPATTAKLEDLMAHLEGLVTADSQADHSAEVPTEVEGFPFLEPAQGPEELGRLGDYRVLRLLGRGGMGYVFHAEDTRLKRAVGLKVLRHRAQWVDAAHQRFLDEARAMAAVKHDHIAVVFQVGEMPGGAPEQRIAYLAMELLEGESLEAWMRENVQPPVDWILRIGREAADGLAAAHAAGLIHRDVKPSNLWLEAPAGWRYESTAERPPLGAVGRIKLIDFGLAAPTEQLATNSGAFVGGTPGYIAPEQIRGDAITGQSDLYSLGCVLYQLCTGRHPFPSRGFQLHSFIQTPTPVRERNRNVPLEFAKLIEKMLANDPADRPASALEVARQLAAVEENIRNVPLRKPRRWPAAIAGVAALVVLGIVLFPRDRKPPDVASATSQPTPATIPEPDPKDRPPFPAGPPDDYWCKKIHELLPAKQFQLVSRKLEELNAGYNHEKATGWVEKDVVIRYAINLNVVHDLRPLRALDDLKKVRCTGTAPGKGILTDLSPLMGLRLYTLEIFNNPKLQDLSPLRALPLVEFDASHTAVDSLDALNGTRLEELRINGTPVKDLGPVRAMRKLQILECVACPITSFEPLIGSNIVELKATLDRDRDGPVLKRMPKLKIINGMPAKDF